MPSHTCAERPAANLKNQNGGPTAYRRKPEALSRTREVNSLTVISYQLYKYHQLAIKKPHYHMDGRVTEPAGLTGSLLDSVALHYIHRRVRRVFLSTTAS